VVEVADHLQEEEVVEVVAVVDHLQEVEEEVVEHRRELPHAFPVQSSAK